MSNPKQELPKEPSDQEQTPKLKKEFMPIGMLVGCMIGLFVGNILNQEGVFMAIGLMAGIVAVILMRRK